MTKTEQIVTLFKREFADFDQFAAGRAACAFKCCNSESCNVKLDKEAAYTPAIGDDNTEVMIVAESPSTKLGQGAYTAGHVTKFDPKDKSMNKMIAVITKHHGGVAPYFTDVIKCGLQKTKSKEVLTGRSLCIDKFLVKEIAIMQPKKIIALGKYAYDILLKLQVSGKVSKEISIVQVTHYSQRASLPLTISDKSDIIWPLELGLIDRETAMKLVLNLTHLANKINRLPEKGKNTVKSP